MIDVLDDRAVLRIVRRANFGHAISDSVGPATLCPADLERCSDYHRHSLRFAVHISVLALWAIWRVPKCVTALLP